MITLLITGLIIAVVLPWSFFVHTHRRNDRLPSEFRRIRSMQQSAMSDIRRRREHAEEQLRRLSRWQS